MTARDDAPAPLDPAPEPHTGLMGRFRNYFLTGLIVTGPIAITLYLVWWFVTWVDGVVRPFVPLVKKFVGNDSPDAIHESRLYKLYLQTAHPVERAFARLWPGMLAFQMIFEAARK